MRNPMSPNNRSRAYHLAHCLENLEAQQLDLGLYTTRVIT